MTVGHGSAIRDVLADAVDNALGSGAQLRFYSSGYVALLCTINLNTPAFGGASSGTITLQGVGSGLEGTCTGGTIAKFRLVTSGAVEVVNGDVGISGQDINLSNNVVQTGDVIRITGLTYSAPA